MSKPEKPYPPPQIDEEAGHRSCREQEMSDVDSGTKDIKRSKWLKFRCSRDVDVASAVNYSQTLSR
jgi:hypothetical protein